MKRIPSLLLCALLASCATAPASHGPVKLSAFAGAGHGTGFRPASSSSGGGLSPIADQTTLANVSGSTANPSATTAAQMRTMLGVQTSSAVAITGGTITGVQLTSMTGFPFGWALNQYATMLSLVPSLTKFQYLKPGGFYGLGAAIATTTTGDGNCEGGCFTPPNTATNVRAFSGTTFQTPKSGKWAFCVRAAFTVPTSGRVMDIGLFNAAATHQIDFGAAFVISSTKWELETNGGSAANTTTTANADANPHDFCLSNDATTIKLYIDGSDSGAHLASTAVNSDEGYVIGIQNTNTGDAKIYDLAFGYVGP